MPRAERTTPANPQSGLNDRDRLSRHHRQLRHILGLIEDMSWDPDLSRALRRALRRLRRQLSVSGGAILLRDGGGWRLRVSQGLAPEERRLLRSGAPEHWDLENRLIQNRVVELPPLLEGGGDGAWVATPCLASDRLVGALLLRRGEVPIPPEELALLETIGPQIGVVIRTSRLLELVSHGKADWEETFDSITDMILIMDPRCRIVRANRSTAERFGLEVSDLPGLHCRELFGYSQRHCRGCPMKESRRTGEPSFREERLPGLHAVFHISVFPRFDRQGHLKRSVHVYRDVSEEHHLREQVRIMDKLSSLGQFVGGVAHELNNPIQAIMVFNQLLLEEAQGNRHRRLLERMHQECIRCAKIIQGLSSIGAWGPSHHGPAELHEIIRNALLLKSYDLERCEIELELELGAHSDLVWGDAFRLRQMMANLLTNSIEAVTGRDTRRIRIRSRNLGGLLRVSVEDSGRGIAPEHQGKVFDPFFSTRDGPNIGLGLSVVYGIVKDHAGSIRITSEPGKGTTAALELPVHGEPV